MNSQNISITGRPGETADYWSEPAGPLLGAVAILLILGVVGYGAFMLFVMIALRDAHFGF